MTSLPLLQKAQLNQKNCRSYNTSSANYAAKDSNRFAQLKTKMETCSVALKIRLNVGKITSDNISNLSKPPPTENNTRLHTQHSSIGEIIVAIKSLKRNEAAGLDQGNAEMLKACPYSSASALQPQICTNMARRKDPRWLAWRCTSNCPKKRWQVWMSELSWHYAPINCLQSFTELH